MPAKTITIAGGDYDYEIARSTEDLVTLCSPSKPDLRVDIRLGVLPKIIEALEQIRKD